MITLNKDKELVRIHDWTDITKRPDYESSLDPNSTELDSIIGSYVLQEEIPCGLSSCHTPHKRGYLVATKSQYVTNIGNICGKKYFSVEFEALRKSFDKDIKIKTQKENIQSFQSRIPEFEEMIDVLKNNEKGAVWIYKKIQLLRTPGKGTPKIVIDTLNNVARTGNTTISKQRLATKEEIENLEVIEGKKIDGLRYIDEPIGSIAGIRALNDEYDLRKILILDLEEGIERISGLDIENISEHQLQFESKWVGESEGKFETVNSAIKTGREFLKKENISQLIDILEDEEEILSMKNVISQL